MAQLSGLGSFRRWLASGYPGITLRPFQELLVRRYFDLDTEDRRWLCGLLWRIEDQGADVVHVAMKLDPIRPVFAKEYLAALHVPAGKTFILMLLRHFEQCERLNGAFTPDPIFLCYSRQGLREKAAAK